jgi:hypothetical protein
MQLPDDRQRMSIIGTTGSGKTQAALWHLSHRNFHQMPWIIYNWKREESLDGIPYHRVLPLDKIPASPGIYVSHPLPDDGDAVEAQMWAVWNKENIGVYVDEGYMLGNRNPAFRALLTQGRSKHIPMIVLSQRPCWMDTFVFTESEFFQVFRLNSSDDIKRTQKFVRANLDAALPEYHSWYYSVKANEVCVLRPVPDLQTIYNTFERRLRPMKQVI